MTIYNESGIGAPGRATKRIKDLFADAREVEVESEDTWLVRQPMDDFWQRWVRVDKEWAAMTEWKAREKFKQNP